MKKLSRRHVLRGLGGAVLALPFLEGLRPRSAKASDDLPPFAIFFRQASGVACEQSTGEIGDEPERFWPRQFGELTPANMNERAVDELADYRSRLLIVKNVNMRDFRYGDGHARGALQGLTARGPTVENAGGSSEAAGESIDHRLGREINPDGRDSLFLYAGPSGGWLGGACISYRGSAQRRAGIRNPWTAYQTMAGSGSGLSPQEATLVARGQKSVNDLVRSQVRRLMSSPELSEADRHRLDLHFTSIRELEVALACHLAEEDERRLETGASLYESNNGEDLMQTAQLHMDVAALAVACGYTRSVAIQFGNGNDGNTRFLDPDTGDRMENYHYISHRRQSHDASGTIIPGSDILHHKIDRYFAQMFRHLIERLDAYELPNGRRLLDTGVAVWYNDNGNGPGHSNRNCPFILAGSCNGFFRQGLYIEAAGGRDANHNKILNTIASAVGLRKSNGDYVDDFGDPSLERGLMSELMT